MSPQSSWGLMYPQGSFQKACQYYCFCLLGNILDEIRYGHIPNYIGIKMLLIKATVTQQNCIKKQRRWLLLNFI